MIDKLLVRPNPHNDESQESFLYRLAIQNHRTISDVSTLLSRSDSVSSRTRNRGDNGTSSFEKRQEVFSINASGTTVLRYCSTFNFKSSVRFVLLKIPT